MERPRKSRSRQPSLWSSPKGSQTRGRTPDPSKPRVLEEWWKAPDKTYCGLLKVDGKDAMLPMKSSQCQSGLDVEGETVELGYILTIDGTIYHLGSPGPILEVRVVGSKHNITTRSTAFLFEVVEEGNVKRIWKLISDIQGSCYWSTACLLAIDRPLASACS